MKRKVSYFLESFGINMTNPDIDTIIILCPGLPLGSFQDATL